MKIDIERLGLGRGGGLGIVSGSPLRCFASPTLQEAGFTVLATGALFWPLFLARGLRIVPKWPWQIFMEVFQDIQRQKTTEMGREEEDLLDYYRGVAEDYDKLYQRDDPTRREEILNIANEIRETLRDHTVLEIACGTGFWTKTIGEVAKHVVGIDRSTEMLKIARKRCESLVNVELCVADAYTLEQKSELSAGRFDAGFAGFWFSHIPGARIGEFLDGFHARLGPGAIVLMVDSVHLSGVGGDPISVPGKRDTFKRRRLRDGSAHMVLKNYYDSDQLHSMLGNRSEDLHIRFGRYYWRAKYVVGQQ